MSVREPEQLFLPVEIRHPQEVRWEVAEETEWRNIGGKMVMVMGGDPQYNSVAVEKIEELEDAGLRYALRFAAASQAMRWVESGKPLGFNHDVSIIATNEDTKSRLLGQHYSGMAPGGRDTFMEDLRSFAPSSNEDH